MALNPNQEPAGFNQHTDGGKVVTAYSIGKWLLSAREAGATHMLVVCDTYDYDDYPVNVMPADDVHEVEANYRAKPMQKVMEVYWLHGDLEGQLDKPRSFTYGPAGSGSNE